MRTLLALVLSLAACGGGPLDVPFDPTRPQPIQTGLYDFAVDTHADDCTSPSRAPFVSTDVISEKTTELNQGLTLPIPTRSGTIIRQGLIASQGFASNHDGITDCGHFETRSVRLTAVSEGHLEARVIEEYTDDPECVAAGLTPGACRVDRTIRYDLVKTCTSPLRVLFGPNLEIDCL